MKAVIPSAIRLFLIMTLLTGVIYPLTVTGLAMGLFLYRAGGSLLRRDGQVIGSELLAQRFRDPAYFWPRPSASDYGTVPSGASNLGRMSASLADLVREREVRLKRAHSHQGAVPADLLFASGSGLDPHLSPEAVWYQMERIAGARGFGPEGRLRLRELVQRRYETPQWGFLGKPRVNVLLLNLDLDRME